MNMNIAAKHHIKAVKRFHQLSQVSNDETEQKHYNDNMRIALQSLQRIKLQQSYSTTGERINNDVALMSDSAISLLA